MNLKKPSWNRYCFSKHDKKLRTIEKMINRFAYTKKENILLEKIP